MVPLVALAMACWSRLHLELLRQELRTISFVLASTTNSTEAGSNRLHRSRQNAAIALRAGRDVTGLTQFQRHRLTVRRPRAVERLRRARSAAGFCPRRWISGIALSAA